MSTPQASKPGSPDSKASTVSETPIALPLMASLTLGLAPWFPEPHLFGKIQWVMGGAVGMGPMDWFDVVMHGAPWVWLAFTLVQKGLKRART